MNIFIGILLLCALLGLWDKISGGKMGLAAEFDGGLASMASLALSIVGIYCIGVTAVRSNPEAIASFASRLPFDASVLIGSLLAPDLGGHAIAKELAATPALGIYSGVMVSSCLGALISFTLPIALTVIRREDTSLFMQGSVWGIVTIPAGVAVGALLIGLPVKELVRNLLPILLLCVCICLALIKAAEATIRVLSVVGNLVRIDSLVLFALVMLGLFLPACQIASDTLIFESLTIVAKIAVVVAGSMVAASLILRFFQKGIGRIAGWLGVNSYSVVGLIISLATCISMIPMMEKMDDRGKVMNAAFAVSGSFVLGGSWPSSPVWSPRRWYPPLLPPSWWAASARRPPPWHLRRNPATDPGNRHPWSKKTAVCSCPVKIRAGAGGCFVLRRGIVGLIFKLSQKI